MSHVRISKVNNYEIIKHEKSVGRRGGDLNQGLPVQFANQNTNSRLVFNISVFLFSCEVDTNTHILSQTDHETKFVFRIFEMTGHKGDVGIKCEATICDTSDALSSKQCDQHCI